MKRSFDLTIAAVSLVLLSPLMAVLAVAVGVAIGQPVIFRQRRPGLAGRPFVLYKFRTMTEARGADGELLPDAKRLTSFGRFLRRASLDELPELWNVVRGDMSLVGPRPLRMEYLALYSRSQARRHEVRPGITGWAQIHGRNAITWEQKFAYDVWYVDHRTFFLDLRILLVTLWKTITGNGISADGHATMPRFTGNGDETEGTRQVES